MDEHIGTLVVFGALGDLAKRLLLPGLGQLLDHRKHKDFQLIGVGTNKFSDAKWRDEVRKSFASAGASGSGSSRVADSATYVQADVTTPVGLKRVFAACSGVPAFYFALPPAVTMASCEAMKTLSLPEHSVFGMEKPFGTDLRSAIELNRLVATVIPEDSVHRVDHFLGKSTVLNLLGLRFANRVFEQVWNRDNVAKVEIFFDEQLALEGRAGYYDKAGALVDMIQSHLLLVMAVVAMEAPSSIDAGDLRGAMAQALRATRVWGGDAASASRRARYTAGTVSGESIPSYTDEPGVTPKRNTETLAEVTFEVQNWRWAGVPFVLRSGKALGDTRKNIVITFKDVPHLPGGFSGPSGQSQLRIGLGPDEIELGVRINGEGDPFTLDPVKLSTSFARGELPPYGEVLSGIMRDDPTFSVRSDEVEECWRIVTPVLAAWAKNDVPIDEYPAGSTGPEAWMSTPGLA
ncbi:MAG: glucose-6-phosphate dehydrogenase [Terrimesophilobacter sp.]